MPIVYKPQTRKGPVLLTPTNEGPPTITLSDGRVITGVPADQRGGVFKGHEGYQWVFPADVLGQSGATLTSGGKTQALANTNMSYRGDQVGGLQESDKGAVGSANAGQLGDPNDIKFDSIDYKPIKYKPIETAPFKFTDPIEAAGRYGEFNKRQEQGAYETGKIRGQELTELDIQGTEAYAKRMSGLQTEMVGAENAFNQAQRLKAVDFAMPDLRSSLDAKKKRGDTYASGRLLGSAEDRAYELAAKSASADGSAVRGFGDDSVFGKRTSDVLTAQQRLGVSQMGEGILNDWVTQGSSILIDTPLKSSISQRLPSTPQILSSQHASQQQSALSKLGTIDPQFGISTEVNQQQFSTNLEQGNRQFNAANKLNTAQFNASNTLAKDQFNASGNFAESQAKFSGLQSNWTLATQAAERADAIHRQELQNEAAARAADQNVSAQQRAANAATVGQVVGTIATVAPIIADMVNGEQDTEATHGNDPDTDISPPESGYDGIYGSGGSSGGGSSGGGSSGGGGSVDTPIDYNEPVDIAPPESGYSGGLPDNGGYDLGGGSSDIEYASTRSDVAPSGGGGSSGGGGGGGSSGGGFTTSGGPSVAPKAARLTASGAPAEYGGTQIPVTSGSLDSTISAQDVSKGMKTSGEFISRLGQSGTSVPQFTALGTVLKNGATSGQKITESFASASTPEAKKMLVDQLHTAALENADSPETRETVDKLFAQVNEHLDTGVAVKGQAAGIAGFVQNYDQYNGPERVRAITNISVSGQDLEANYGVKDLTAKSLNALAIPGTSNKMTVQDARSLTNSGYNVSSLVRNWDDVEEVNGTLSGKENVLSVASTARNLGLIDDDTPETVKARHDALTAVGAEPSGAWGAGAVAVPANNADAISQVGYVPIGTTSDGKTVAIPKESIASTGVSTGVIGAGVTSDGAGLKKLTIGQRAAEVYQNWDTDFIPKQQNQMGEKTAVANGLYKLGAKDPYVVGNIILSSAEKSQVSKETKQFYSAEARSQREVANKASVKNVSIKEVDRPDAVNASKRVGGDGRDRADAPKGDGRDRADAVNDASNIPAPQATQILKEAQQERQKTGNKGPTTAQEVQRDVRVVNDLTKIAAAAGSETAQTAGGYTAAVTAGLNVYNVFNDPNATTEQKIAASVAATQAGMALYNSTSGAAAGASAGAGAAGGAGSAVAEYAPYVAYAMAAYQGYKVMNSDMPNEQKATAMRRMGEDMVAAYFTFGISSVVQWADQQFLGGTLQKWREKGEKLNPMMAVNDKMVGMALTGMSGEGKDKDQHSRDLYRTHGQRLGVIDQEYKMTLASGQKFDVGVDGHGGTREWFNKTSRRPDQTDIDTLHAYDVDYTRDLDAVMNVGGLALSTLLYGSADNENAQKMGNYFTNASVSDSKTATLSKDGFGTAQANMQGFFKQAGVDTKQEAYALSNQMLQEGRLSQTQLISVHQGINLAFDSNAFQGANNLLEGVKLGRKGDKAPEPQNIGAAPLLTPVTSSPAIPKNSSKPGTAEALSPAAKFEAQKGPQQSARASGKVYRGEKIKNDPLIMQSSTAEA